MQTEHLLTPEEAANRLLEASTERAFRTDGVDGLWPVTVGDQRLFREQDVDAFVQRKLRRGE